MVVIVLPVRSLISSNTSATLFKLISVTSLSRVTAVKSSALDIVAVMLVALGKSTAVKADPASATAPATVPCALLAVAAVKIAPNCVALLVSVTITVFPSKSPVLARKFC